MVTPVPSKIEVFFSYAREDGALRDKLANHLKLLERQGTIQSWHDRQILAGTEWQEQIHHHLETAQIILLLISSDFLASDYCYNIEMQRALERHNVGDAWIIPIILRPIDNWTQSPFGELCALPTDNTPVTAWKNEDAAFANVARGIRLVVEAWQCGKRKYLSWSEYSRRDTTVKKRTNKNSTTQIYGFPPLPNNYLIRETDLKSLKDLILQEAHNDTLTKRQFRHIGIRGMGGIGKSVLASAICLDEEVKLAFPDGIFWIPLGQNPELIGWQAFICESLDKCREAFTSVAIGKAHLGKILAHKKCLLVLDDVWQHEHRDAFNVLTENCQLLITTRDHSIITSLGAYSYEVRVLAQEQSMSLIAQWVKLSVAELPDAARSIIEECDNLPLAIAIVGAMVNAAIERKRPEPWNNILSKLRSASLEKIKAKFPDYPYPNLLKAIKVSVDALEPDIKERYLDFAIFREDMLISEQALQRLWSSFGLTEADVEDTVDELVSKSLLALNDYESNHNSRLLSLHDLLLDYVRKEIEIQKDIESLNERHCRILEGYRKECLHDDWSTGPDDGYFFAELAYHLISANCSESTVYAEELRKLLLNFSWISAKLESTSILLLINDFNYLPNDNCLQIIQGALRLSAHVLIRDKYQLASQLIARLSLFKVSKIHTFLDQAREVVIDTWLRPLVPSLTPPGGQLLRTIEDLTDTATAITVTPDNKKIISATSNGIIKIWDISTGKKQLAFRGHDVEISSLMALPSGNLLISVAIDDSIKVWSIATGDKKIDLISPENITDVKISSVALLPGCMRIMAILTDATLRCWSIRTGEEIQVEAHKNWKKSVSQMRVTSDGKVIWGIANGNLKVWDWETGTSFPFKRTMPKVKLFTCNSQSSRALTFSSDQKFRVWDMTRPWNRYYRSLGLEDNVSHVLEVGSQVKNKISAISITNDGKKMIEGSESGEILLRDIDTGTILFQKVAHTQKIIAIEVTSDDQTAISISEDGIIKIWSLVNSNPLFKLHEAYDFQDHHNSVLATLTSSDRAISASADKTIKVWDLNTKRELYCIDGHNGGVLDLAFFPDMKIFISSALDKTLRYWNLDTGSEIKRLDLQISTDLNRPRYLRRIDEIGGAKCVTCSYDGELIAAGSSNGIINVWRQNIRRPTVINTYTGDIESLQFTNDGKFIIVGLIDGNIRAWNIKTEDLSFSLCGHKGKITALLVSADGELLFSASADQTIKIWHIHRREELKIAKQLRHDNVVTSLALLSSKPWLVSTSIDQTIKVWDLNCFKSIASFTGERPFTTCAVSSDDMTITVGDDLGRVHFFRLENLSHTTTENYQSY